MSNIVWFGGATRLDRPPEDILEEAKGAVSGGVVVMGYDEDGNEYFASSIANGPDVLWLMERMKLALLQVEVEE